MIKLKSLLEVKLEIDDSDFYRSHESANIRAKSPTGKTIWIYKKYIDRFTPEELKVWKKLINGVTDYSTKEMKLMLDMSELYGLKRLKR